MIVVVCGVIGDAKGCHLACLRPARSHLGGFWEFPGGKVNSGELPEAALARELLEELGVAVEVGAPLSPVEWAYPDKVIRLLPYRCKIISGDLVALEHDELRWCDPAQLLELRWAEADVPILHELLSDFAKDFSC